MCTNLGIVSPGRPHRGYQPYCLSTAVGWAPVAIPQRCARYPAPSRPRNLNLTLIQMSGSQMSSFGLSSSPDENKTEVVACALTGDAAAGNAEDSSQAQPSCTSTSSFSATARCSGVVPSTRWSRRRNSPPELLVPTGASAGEDKQVGPHTYKIR